MRFRFSSLVLLIAFVSACTVDTSSTDAIPESTVGERLTQPSPLTSIELPFDNPFPNRVNPSNDGTTFEPCVAYSDAELARFAIDAGMVADAAQVDHQGIRGCNWFMIESYSLVVVVTNAETLDSYKRAMSTLEWKSDITINGRTVGLADLPHSDNSCATYVESSRAIVSTDIIISPGQQLKRYNPCKIAIDFTTAYLNKIPI